MDDEADLALTKYFVDNLKRIESWFNVIAPKDRQIKTLNAMLKELGKVEV